MENIIEIRKNSDIGQSTEISACRNDTLKLFAMLTMLIDHIGYMFFPQYRIFRTIGRLAFPIFAYQLSVGYAKTSNLKKYSARLLCFGLISQIPYSFFSPNLEFEPFRLNIMFTLLLALGVLYVYDIGIAKVKAFKDSGNYKDLLTAAASFLCILAALVIPELLEISSGGKFRLEYGIYGLLIILIFHIYKEKKASMLIGLVLISFLYAYLTGVKTLVPNFSDWTAKLRRAWIYSLNFRMIWERIVSYKNGLMTLEGFFFQSRAIFALIPIYAFEAWGTKVKINKYAGYLFYPIHITILLLIASFI